MKKKTEKRLSLGKIKIADLSKSTQGALKGGMLAIVTFSCAASCKFACPSQGAPVCSEDSCII